MRCLVQFRYASILGGAVQGPRANASTWTPFRNLRKIRILLQAIDNLGCEVDYYALDLSSSELERSLEQIFPGTFKHVRCHGLLGTYDDGRKWLQRPENLHRPKCILSLGSTIGSFTRPEAAEFLSKFAASLDCKVSSHDPQHAVESSVLIALDGCMIGEKVYRAYNDAQGLNCSFILNALDHANHVLGYEAFRKSEWTIRGEWNAAAGSHDQYLVPLQDVAFDGRDFEAGKRIPVVSSFKYDVKHKAQLWKAAGLIEKARWTKSNGSYGESPTLARCATFSAIDLTRPSSSSHPHALRSRRFAKLMSRSTCGLRKVSIPIDY